MPFQLADNINVFLINYLFQIVIVLILVDRVCNNAFFTAGNTPLPRSKPTIYSVVRIDFRNIPGQL